VDGYDPTTGVYEQFAGFYRMAEVHPSRLEARPMPADAMFGRQVTLASKVIKQADVLMLAHMLPEEFPTEVMRANYEYYEPFTSHGSSLSPAMHATISSRIGLPERALDEIRMARDVDMSDNLGSAAGGLHMATMGGMWQALIQGFGGVRRIGDALSIDPQLPAEWPRLSFAVRFRGAAVKLELATDEIRLEVREAPLEARLAGRPMRLGVGSHVFNRDGNEWVPA
jgi:trehalose/maltose hydrolase-like predicted phosphorylase